MTVRGLFVGADGRVHPPWRLVLFLGICLLCAVVATIALTPLLQPIERFTGLDGTTEAYLTLVVLLIAHWATFRTVDRRPWSFVWLDQGAARSRTLVAGVLLGAVPIGAVSLVLVSVGLLDFQRAVDGPWLRVALQSLVFLLPAAVFEELFSRGYIFATLAEWLGRGWAVAATSLGFGVLHYANPGATAQSLALVTLAGVYLAVVLLATQSMYAAWAAHFAWNWVMAALLHVPVSGIALSRPDYQIVDAGPDWITGGSWGPEGGVGAAVGMLGGLAYLYWRRKQP